MQRLSVSVVRKLDIIMTWVEGERFLISTKRAIPSIGCILISTRATAMLVWSKNSRASYASIAVLTWYPSLESTLSKRTSRFSSSSTTRTDEFKFAPLVFLFTVETKFPGDTNRFSSLFEWYTFGSLAITTFGGRSNSLATPEIVTSPLSFPFKLSKLLSYGLSYVWKIYTEKRLW